MDIVMINKVTEMDHRLSTHQGKDLVRGHVEGMQHKVEQDRLAGKVEGDGKAWDVWQLATLALGSLLGLVVAGLV